MIFIKSNFQIDFVLFLEKIAMSNFDFYSKIIIINFTEINNLIKLLNLIFFVIVKKIMFSLTAFIIVNYCNFNKIIMNFYFEIINFINFAAYIIQVFFELFFEFVLLIVINLFMHWRFETITFNYLLYLKFTVNFAIIIAF